MFVATFKFSFYGSNVIIEMFLGKKCIKFQSSAVLL